MADTFGFIWLSIDRLQVVLAAAGSGVEKNRLATNPISTGQRIN
jgi:hypothetical protein